MLDVLFFRGRDGVWKVFEPESDSSELVEFLFNVEWTIEEWSKYFFLLIELDGPGVHAVISGVSSIITLSSTEFFSGKTFLPTVKIVHLIFFNQSFFDE